MNANVLVEDRGAVRIITINRPERRNAIDRATADLLYETFQEFDADDNVSVAVFTGAGSSFCGGYDLKSLTDDIAASLITEGGENELGPMGPSRMFLSKPVIAAIEGYAVAGGLELAIWCDLRVVAEDATFGVFCRRFGVPMVDGGSVRLPRLIGQSRAMDMLLTGRTVDAQESERIGLANRVVAKGTALEESIALAEQLCRFPQTCMRNDRISMLQQWGLNHDEALRNEIRIGVKTKDSGETVDGANRFANGAGRHGAFPDS